MGVLALTAAVRDDENGSLVLKLEFEEISENESTANEMVSCLHREVIGEGQVIKR